MNHCASRPSRNLDIAGLDADPDWTEDGGSASWWRETEASRKADLKWAPGMEESTRRKTRKIKINVSTTCDTVVCVCVFGVLFHAAAPFSAGRGDRRGGVGVRQCT